MYLDRWRPTAAPTLNDNDTTRYMAGLDPGVRWSGQTCDCREAADCRLPVPFFALGPGRPVHDLESATVPLPLLAGSLPHHVPRASLGSRTCAPPALRTGLYDILGPHPSTLSSSLA